MSTSGWRRGRILIVGPSRASGNPAEAIDLAFARLDLAHLHGFELADGRRIDILIPITRPIGSTRRP